MPGINLDGLTDAQRELVSRFVRVLRASKGDESTRKEFLNAWQEWKEAAPELSEDEADAVVAEAVAHARGR